MGKKRSKVLIDLIKGDINVQQALESLDLLLEDLYDESIKNWVNNELNGYNDSSELPDYRIIDCYVVGSIQISPINILQNITIPLTKEGSELIYNVNVRDSISVILQYSKAENENDSHSICAPLDAALVNHYKNVNGTVIKAERRLSLYSYTNILNNLRTKLISIFKELEKNYGNLDDYYIDFENDDKIDKVVKNITNIIYMDKSVTIGDNNEIKDSVVGEEIEC